jgi:predicted XRE-type DNA-binding protein
MSHDRFTSVWDALEDTPQEAENLRLRSVLMMALKDHLTQAGLTQAQAAKLMGVTQPRVSDLLRGKIHLFSLDTLVNMAASAGLHIELHLRHAA